MGDETLKIKKDGSDLWRSPNHPIFSLFVSHVKFQHVLVIIAMSWICILIPDAMNNIQSLTILPILKNILCALVIFAPCCILLITIYIVDLIVRK